MELSSNKEEKTLRYNAKDVPLLVTIGEVEKYLVIDLNREERESIETASIVTAN